jgi:hypothetical protein
MGEATDLLRDATDELLGRFELSSSILMWKTTSCGENERNGAYTVWVCRISNA